MVDEKDAPFGPHRGREAEWANAGSPAKGKPPEAAPAA